MDSVGGAYRKIVKDGYMYKYKDLVNGYTVPFHISEYIACKIVKKLGLSVQEVELSLLHREEVCKIEIFDGFVHQAYGMGNSTMGTSNLPRESLNNNRLELLLNMIDTDNNDKFAFTQKEFNRFLSNILLTDFLTLNTDRHFGNIGFLYTGGKYNLAPLYDFNLSLDVLNFYTNKANQFDPIDYKTQFRYKGKKLGVKKIVGKYPELFNDSNDLVDKILNTNVSDILNDVSEYNKEYNEYLKHVYDIIELNKIYLDSVFNKSVKIRGLTWQ